MSPDLLDFCNIGLAWAWLSRNEGRPALTGQMSARAPEFLSSVTTQPKICSRPAVAIYHFIMRLPQLILWLSKAKSLAGKGVILWRIWGQHEECWTLKKYCIGLKMKRYLVIFHGKNNFLREHLKKGKRDDFMMEDCIFSSWDFADWKNVEVCCFCAT